MTQSDGRIPETKWVKGVTPDQSVYDAAHEILKSRLSAVWYWLPLAAEKANEDIEYVHQLRVATRRAVAAVRVFSDLIPKASRQVLRARLRQVRRAANEARNLDVLYTEFVHRGEELGSETHQRVAEAMKRKREAAQQPILAAYNELLAGNFDKQIAATVDSIRSAGKDKSKPKFGRQARRYLKPVLKKFFRESQADLSDDAALHQLRIRTKQLRYTMEIVEVAFRRCFRKKLYPRITELQEVMGMLNDHATARATFGELLREAGDTNEKVFLEGVLSAEAKAHEDLRRAFQVCWTPKTFRKLRKQFRRCCGRA